MTIDQRKLKLAVVIPVFNEKGNLATLYERVAIALDTTGLEWEILFVDDGSSDGSLEEIKDLTTRDGNVRFVSLSRNFGHQAALFAGLKTCKGDAVITLDADLQHPPELISDMVSKWREGYEVVFTIKSNHHMGWLKGAQMRLFYWTLSRISGLHLSFGQSDFRLLDRRALDAVLEITEYRKFLRGTVEWVGFKQIGIEYEVGERYSGSSKFSYRSMVSFALDGILSFSSLPLRLFTWFGFATAFLCGLYAMYVLVLWIMSLRMSLETLPPGWASIAVAVTFLGGVQLMAIGVLGEYLSRVFDQSKGRPVFIIRESSDKENGVYLG